MKSNKYQFQVKMKLACCKINNINRSLIKYGMFFINKLQPSQTISHTVTQTNIKINRYAQDNIY